MKTATADRTLLGSAATHATILVAIVSASLLRGCLLPHKPRELVTFIALQEPAPQIADLQMPPLPEPPKPEDPKPPEPEPPKDIPEPPKDPPKPKPPKVVVSTNRIVRPKPQPPKPQVKPPTAEELRRMLASGKPLGPPGPVGPVSDFPFDWYFALVRKAMYDAWEQPGGLSASAGLKVIVEVRVARDGTVLKRDVIRPSGHPLMDESVNRAVQAVTRLPALPAEYRGGTRDIQIAFELTGALM